MRFCNAPSWSGMMTSHSCGGAEVEAIVRAIVVLGLEIGMKVRGTDRKVRRASIERRASSWGAIWAEVSLRVLKL